ncbi:transporter substrate-binding domain-containing protein [Chitinimonas arctica]|uniref:Transporter substrate-binding domain-containing protein n=1 Tax=Chitinimonas arctica TaxID=2594795 RepID=A0A516S9P5_9NEIS|nr:transporter substrate-binding domain-containing protein [Chitinimonas arctica]QDQ24881.1 transporter substrate-binding domain-containing protein [Chitinimonas arctica]
MFRLLALLPILLLALAAHAAERVRIGAENDWYPYSGVVGGQPAGLAVDLVRAAYAAVGVEVELVSLPYARCMKLTRESLLAGCFDTLRNPLLEKQYRWHKQALFKGRIDIYARIDRHKGRITLADLRGKRIAVTNGYDYGEAFDANKQMQRDIGDSDLFALRKLVAGRVDYALVYDRIATHIARNEPQLGAGYKSVGTLIEPEIYLSFAPAYPEVEKLIGLFDQGLEKLHASGEYARIEARRR